MKNINTFSVQVCYPDDTIMPELSEAKEYYKMALSIREIILHKIELQEGE